MDQHLGFLFLFEGGGLQWYWLGLMGLIESLD